VNIPPARPQLRKISILATEHNSAGLIAFNCAHQVLLSHKDQIFLRHRKCLQTQAHLLFIWVASCKLDQSSEWWLDDFVQFLESKQFTLNKLSLWELTLYDLSNRLFKLIIGCVDVRVSITVHANYARIIGCHACAVSTTLLSNSEEVFVKNLSALEVIQQDDVGVLLAIAWVFILDCVEKQLYF